MTRSPVPSLPVLPVVLITGGKDSGKTSLATALIRLFGRSGRAVVALKRASEILRPDLPGTDSERLGGAGAMVTALTWPGGTYVAHLGRGLPQPVTPSAILRRDRQSSLQELLSMAVELLGNVEMPLAIAEGFSDSPYPRLHVLPQAGEEPRAAAGPLLGTWQRPVAATLGAGLGPGDTCMSGVMELAARIDRDLPQLSSWAEEVARTPAGVPARPGTAGIIAAVLVGGKGSRLGGRNKWSLKVGGRLQSRRCLGVLADLFNRILVVGGSSQGPVPEEPAGALVTGVPDLVPAGGVLGGLLAALTAALPNRVFVLAGDMPFPSRAFIRHMLWTAHLRPELDAIIPTWGGHVEPLHAIYAPACLPRLADIMKAPGHQASRPRVIEMLVGLRVGHIPETEIRLFGDPHTLFLNINTPGDLVRAEDEASVLDP